MRNLLIRSLTILLVVASIAPPALAAGHGRRPKQTDPAYWSQAPQSGATQDPAAKATAKPERKLPRLPKPAASRAPVDYGDVEIVP